MDILKSTIVNSLGMTLLHSLWQILSIYIILRIVLSLLKRSNSVSRYNISVLAMLLVLCLSSATFFIYQGMDEEGDSLVFYHLVQNNGSDAEKIYSYPLPQADAMDIVVEKSAIDYLPWFVLVYFAGILFLSFRLITGIFYLKKYRHKGIVKTDSKLLDVFDRILSKINIKKEVKIIESVLTRVPFVLGYFKPVVIVPVGLMAHLPFNQVEAIIAHELAHIRRNDFLINFIQSVIELLFFYHPAIYLISKHIRDERENACDDIALEFCESSEQYARALASMEHIRMNVSYPAVAFVKKKNNLLERVKRILKPNPMKTKLSDRIFAGIIIILGLSTIIVTGAAALNNFSPETLIPDSGETSINIGNLYGDTPVSDTIIEFDDGKIITHRKNEKGNNEEIEMVFKDGELTGLRVNGKEVPKEQYPEYKEVIKSTLVDVREAQEDMEKAKAELAEFDEEALRMELEEAMAEIESIDRDAIMADVEEAMAEARREMEEVDWEEIRAEIEEAMAEVDVEEIRDEVRKAMEEIDWEEIRNEIDEAMKEVEINLDTVKLELNEAMQDIDWEEIRVEMEEAMKEVHMSSEEIDLALSEAMASLEAIDVDLINESVRLGLEAAAISLEGLDEILEGSISIGLDVAAEVLSGLDESIIDALEDVKDIDVDEIVREVEESRQQVERDSQELKILEENMVKALEELEKDSASTDKKKK